MRHGRNIRARQTRMRGTVIRMSHEYKKERILIHCEGVSCCALSLSFFIPSLTMADILVKKNKNNNPLPGKDIVCLFQL
jgi:hypothetical protein